MASDQLVKQKPVPRTQGSCPTSAAQQRAGVRKSERPGVQAGDREHADTMGGQGHPASLRLQSPPWRLRDLAEKAQRPDWSFHPEELEGFTDTPSLHAQEGRGGELCFGRDTRLSSCREDRSGGRGMLGSGFWEQVLDMVSQLSRGSDFKGGACAGHTLVPNIFLLTPSGHVPGFTTTTFLG